MTVKEAEEHFKTLNSEERQRFNLLVKVALKLGKPFEGAYDYARTIMDEKQSQGGSE